MIDASKVSNKQLHFVGDINVNLLDYKTNNQLHTLFLNLLFKTSIFPIRTRLTRVTCITAASMDHIVTNLFLSANIYSSALLTNTFDHFLIFTFVSEVIGLNENCKKKNKNKLYLNKK